MKKKVCPKCNKAYLRETDWHESGTFFKKRRGYILEEKSFHHAVERKDVPRIGSYLLITDFCSVFREVKR